MQRGKTKLLESVHRASVKSNHKRDSEYGKQGDHVPRAWLDVAGTSPNWLLFEPPLVMVWTPGSEPKQHTALEASSGCLHAVQSNEVRRPRRR